MAMTNAPISGTVQIQMPAAGPAGAQGPAGPPGPQGPAGVSPTIDINALAVRVAAILAAPPVITPPVNPPPTPGIPKIAVSGKNFTWNGATVQLRGFNMSGLENTAIQGWDPAEPWGDGGGVPQWAVAQTWKPNVIRAPVNAASIQGLKTYDTVTVNGAAAFASAPRNADPGGNSLAALFAAIDSARAIGCATIVDLHWTAPDIALQGVTHSLSPMGQPSFIDANMGLSFWKFIVGALNGKYGVGGYPDVIFELINEPFLNSFSASLSAGSPDAALLLGGTNAVVTNDSQGGANYKLLTSWTMVGYQTLVNTIRGLGATNVILVGGNQWMQNVQNWKAWFPVDPLKQTAVAFHAYSDGAYPYANGDVYWKTTDPGTGTKTVQSYPEAILAAGVPVIITETSGHGGTGATSGEPFVATTLAWADANNVSVVGWQWNGTQAASVAATDNYLTMFAADGKTIVPITGTGVVFHDWMVNHK